MWEPSGDIGPLGPGRPLDDATRARFEAHLARDLGHVRIHDGQEANRATQSVDARAFTYGRHIAFGSGEYSPESSDGRRVLAHELAHVAQQEDGRASSELVQRDLVKQGGSDPKEEPAAPEVHAWPTTGADIDIRGYHLTEDPSQLREQMQLLVAKGLEGGIASIPPGIDAPALLLGRILMSPVDCSGQTDLEECHRNRPQLKVYLALEPVVAQLRAEHEQFLEDFKEAARKNALATLEANETEAKKEAARYGVRTEVIARPATPIAGVPDHSPPTDPMDAGVANEYGPTTYETRISMDGSSPQAKGLQDAAQVLLGRRGLIEGKRTEQASHLKLERDPYDSKGRVLVPDEQWHAIGQQLAQMQLDYDELLNVLSAQYPILEQFAKRSTDATGLEQLARGPGPDTAVMIADKIADTLEKIELSREGLDSANGDVNVWRLPPVVGLTKVTQGVDQDLLKSVLVNEKVRDEQPGILGGIALAVMNIGALLLAAPTGGLSLAVAFGVNAAVAYEHVKDYILEDALAGSSLRQATALSREDPSLFWLAVEIAGLGLDAATVVSTFKALAPLAKTAEASLRSGKGAATALGNLEMAAGPALGKRLATRVRTVAAAGGEEFTEGLRAAKIVSEEELEALGRAGKALQAEAVGESLGTPIATATGGQVKISKGGKHLFSCSSPCTMLREKYAEQLAKNSSFEREMARLEDLARNAKTAEEGTSIASEAANLETRMRLEHVGGRKSPLEGTERYEALLRQRGSAAEKLDRKPPRWTGNKEAEFRGLPDPGDGYHWTLDAEGNLSVGPVRESKNLPRKIYAPGEESGPFKIVGDDIKRSELIGKKMQPRNVAVTADERKAIEDLLEKRKDFMAQRDALEEIEGRALTEAEKKQLAKARSGINKASETLGEQAAERYVSSTFAGAKQVHKGSGSGTFDLVYRWKDATGRDILIVVEAKGGSSGLGTRQVATGARVEQGTGEYLSDIAINMSNSGQMLGSELLIARQEGRVRYLKIQAPIGPDPGVVLRAGEFQLSPP